MLVVSSGALENPPYDADFIIHKGETIDQKMTWSDACGNAIDLTGYTAKLQARYKVTDVSPFLDLSTGNGGIILGGTAGTITIRVSSTATALLDAGRGIYDLRMTDSLGDSSFLLQGAIIVEEMSTR